MIDFSPWFSHWFSPWFSHCFSHGTTPNGLTISVPFAPIEPSNQAMGR